MNNSKNTSSDEPKMSYEGNVIEAIFDPKFYDYVAGEVKVYGLHRVEKMLLGEQFTKDQVKIILKRVLKTRGW